MLFNSYAFLFVFLPLALAGFYALPEQRLRLAFLIAASYVFYAYDRLWFPLLMVASTAFSFSTGLLLERARTPRTRKLTLAGGVALVLGLLVFFKYAQFVSGNLTSVVSVVTSRGLPSVQQFARGIVLPIGISFFTFEGISYMADVYRGVIEPERNVLKYAVFISFFPHLVAGPIVRYAKLEPQLRARYHFDPELFTGGLLLLSAGLVKKVLIADGIARHTDPLLSSPGSLGALQAWTAIVGYSFQIYFDFAGYCDMALGLARMVGIELPWNFDRPYRAASPREFWRRWHVTLSSWLRDYLYIPLGGNRKGARRRDANLLATMGLGGLWHGASFSFVVWGLYHGVLLVAQHAASRFSLRIPRPVAIAATFLLVTVGWVFFRMKTAHGVGDVLGAMVGLHGVGTPVRGLVGYLAVAAVLMWTVPEEWRWRFAGWSRLRVAAVGVAVTLALVYMHTTRPFIYFQF